MTTDLDLSDYNLENKANELKKVPGAEKKISEREKELQMSLNYDEKIKDLEIPLKKDMVVYLTNSTKGSPNNYNKNQESNRVCVFKDGKIYCSKDITYKGYNDKEKNSSKEYKKIKDFEICKGKILISVIKDDNSEEKIEIKIN